MSEENNTPPKPKPGSLRDRIAAFEVKPAGTGPTPPPLRPKPGQVQWKPKPTSPPSSPPAAGSSPSGNVPERRFGGMSAADAKQSIGAGGSLKERMAALQGKAAFGGAPPPPKPATEKPRWKPPPVVSPPVEDHPEGTNEPKSNVEPDVKGEESSEAPPQVEHSESHGEGEDAQVEGEPNPEEEERQRRAQIAARMARLGGARIGMAPVYTKPAVRKPEPVPQKSTEEIPPFEQVVKDDSSAKEDIVTVDSQSPPVTTSPDQTQTDLGQSNDPSDPGISQVSLVSSDGSHSQSPRSTLSMPVPAGPRRAGPPRRKTPKAPAPTNEEPSDLKEAEPVTSPEQVSSMFEKPDEEITESHPHQAEAEATADAQAVSLEPTLTTTDTPEPSDQPAVTETVPDSSDSLTSKEITGEPEQVSHEEPKEDEATRRKRIAERLAQSGGFNPFSGPRPPRRQSSIVSSDSPENPVSSTGTSNVDTVTHPDRRDSYRKSSMDSSHSAAKHPVRQMSSASVTNDRRGSLRQDSMNSGKLNERPVSLGVDVDEVNQIMEETGNEDDDSHLEEPSETSKQTGYEAEDAAYQAAIGDRLREPDHTGYVADDAHEELLVSELENATLATNPDSPSALSDEETSEHEQVRGLVGSTMNTPGPPPPIRRDSRPLPSTQPGFFNEEQEQNTPRSPLSAVPSPPRRSIPPPPRSIPIPPPEEDHLEDATPPSSPPPPVASRPGPRVDSIDAGMMISSSRKSSTQIVDQPENFSSPLLPPSKPGVASPDSVEKTYPSSGSRRNSAQVNMSLNSDVSTQRTQKRTSVVPSLSGGKTEARRSLPPPPRAIPPPPPPVEDEEEVPNADEMQEGYEDEQEYALSQSPPPPLPPSKPRLGSYDSVEGVVKSQPRRQNSVLSGDVEAPITHGGSTKRTSVLSPIAKSEARRSIPPPPRAVPPPPPPPPPPAVQFPEEHPQDAYESPESNTVDMDSQGAVDHTRELMDEEDGDPIDPSFHRTISRSSAKTPEFQTPNEDLPQTQRLSPTLPPQRPSATEKSQEEEGETTRRQTIAERMAKLGGIRFGAPLPVPKPPPRPAAAEDDATSAEKSQDEPAPVQEEPQEEGEEEEAARKARIATKLAGMGGMRFEMFPVQPSPKPSPVAELASPSSTKPVPPRRPTLPPPPPPPPAPYHSEFEEIGSESQSVTDSDLVQIEAEESELEEVTHEEAGVEDAPPPPPRPSKHARQGSTVSVSTDIAPPLPHGRRALSPSSRLPPPQIPAPPSSQSLLPLPNPHSYQDFVMVHDEPGHHETEEEAPPPPPRPVRQPPSRTAPSEPHLPPVTHSLPPIPQIPPPPPPPMQHREASGDPQWSLPDIPSASLDLGKVEDLSSSAWSQDSTNYPQTMHTQQPMASTSVSTVSQPAQPPPRVLGQLNADELLALWGSVGVHIGEVAHAMYDKSKKSLIGDGTYRGFVQAVLGQVPNAARPQLSAPIDTVAHLIYSQTGGVMNRRVCEIMPGDIIVLLDAKLKGHKGLHTYQQHVGTGGDPVWGIVSEFEMKKSKARAYQANQHVGAQSVELISYRLEDLKSGNVTVYRVDRA